MEPNLFHAESKILCEKLSLFESNLSVLLPDDYKSFLSVYSGETFELETLEFKGADGLQNSTMLRIFYSVDAKPAIDLESNARYYVDSGRIPSGIVPIAEDIAGNLICIDATGKSKGTIYFWDHELELDKEGYDNLAVIADSFSEFMRMLRKV